MKSPMKDKKVQRVASGHAGLDEAHSVLPHDSTFDISEKIDRVTDEKIKNICADAGVRYEGIQEVKNGQMVLFTDLLTKTTLAVDKKGFSNPKVQARVTQSRRDYPEELEMQSDIMDAIRFITRTKAIPIGILAKSSVAATVAITEYLKEQKESAQSVISAKSA